MNNMIHRFRLNWEAMEPKKKRKTLVFGFIAVFVFAIIVIGAIEQSLMSQGQGGAASAGDQDAPISTTLSDGPKTYGLSNVIQDNAAYERRQLREDVARQKDEFEKRAAKTDESFDVVNKQLEQIGQKIDGVVRSVDEVSLSVARERTQRRAENEIIAQELSNVGKSSKGGSLPKLSQSQNFGDQNGSSSGNEIVELSPFDLMGFAELSGMEVAHVGYSYEDYQQANSLAVDDGNANKSTVQTAQRNQRVTATTTSQTSTNAQDEGRPDVDELGLDAYDRGELTAIPAGSLMTAVLVTGMDAPVGQTAQSNPHPVIAKLTGRVLMPNGKSMDLRGCVVLASGYGDLSTEKVYLQTTTLSCIDSDNRIFETQVQSSGLGSDGKVGLRGRMVTRDGALIARNMQAGLVQGLALAFQGGNQSFDVTTDQPYALPSTEYLGRTMIGQGVSNSLDTMIQRYNRLMDQIFPVIEIDAGRKIEFQVLSRFDVRVTE